MSLKAVIFDVDGVLVQSMEKHHEAYQKVFAPLGVDVARHEVFAQEGRRSLEVIESIGKERGLDLAPDQIKEMSRRKQEVFFGFGPLPLYPGVEDLLRSLKARGLRIAAVTGTAKVNVRNHLGDLVDLFDAVVTADDVKRTKPDPEPYLSALEKLGLEAREAVVVENATLGLKAAKAAGMPVIGVTSTLSADELKDADALVARVADVARAVEAFG